METKELLVDEESGGKRLDVFLSENLKDLSRSRIQMLLKDGRITVDGKMKKPNYKIKAGEVVTVSIPKPNPIQVEAENIPLDILYEDDQIIVVNKPQGMVVHPAPGNYSGTLVNALLYHCKDLSGINGLLRPGIVHRIDKDTSGVLVVTKTDNAHLKIAEQIKEHSINRIYLTLVHGIVQEPGGMIDAPIGRHQVDRKKMAVQSKGGKRAITHYKVKERFTKDNYTYLEVKLETGRTHQIRVHMAYMGHPVVGDPKYGPKKPHFNLEGQLLHAATLGFKHPVSNEYMEFSAPLPQHFQNIIDNLSRTN